RHSAQRSERLIAAMQQRPGRQETTPERAVPSEREDRLLDAEGEGIEETGATDDAVLVDRVIGAKIDAEGERGEPRTCRGPTAGQSDSLPDRLAPVGARGRAFAS